MEAIFRHDLLNKNDLLIIIFIIFGLLIFATVLFYVIGLINKKADLKELRDRTKSWWIMSFVFIGAVMIDERLSYVSLAFLSFVAFREMYSVLDFRTEDRRAIFWALVAIPIQFYLAYIGWYGAYIIFIPVVMFLFLPLRFVLKGETKGIVKSMSLLQWILMLTVFGLSHLAYLLSLPEIEGFKNGGRGLLLFLVFMTEINDVLQFTWGKLLGKNKIIPKISPNKTWQGFIGGVVSTTIIGYFLGFLTPLGTPHLILVSFMIAISGFVGDIVMSSIKRDIGVKDMGTTIPGHGGILDRIDSLSYTAPVFFHLVYYIAY